MRLRFVLKIIVKYFSFETLAIIVTLTSSVPRCAQTLQFRPQNYLNDFFHFFFPNSALISATDGAARIILPHYVRQKSCTRSLKDALTNELQRPWQIFLSC